MKRVRFLKPLTLLLAQFLCIAAIAQTRDASTMLSSWSTSLKAVVEPVANIVSIVLGLIGFVKLLPIFSKFLKGEPTSADAFLNHGGGFVIAVIMIQLIKMVIV